MRAFPLVDSALALSRLLAEELQREMVSVQWAPQISLRISNFRPGYQAKYFALKGRVVKSRVQFSPPGDAATTAKTVAAIILAYVIN